MFLGTRPVMLTKSLQSLKRFVITVLLPSIWIQLKLSDQCECYVSFSSSGTYRGRHTSCTISVVFEVDVSYPDLPDPAVLGPGLKVCSIDHNIGSECLLCDLLGNTSWQPRSVLLSSDWDWDLGPGTWDLGHGTWDMGPRT